MNGLFNLDDNKDADAPEQKEEMEARAKANVKNAENKKEKAVCKEKTAEEYPEESKTPSA